MLTTCLYSEECRKYRIMREKVFLVLVEFCHRLFVIAEAESRTVVQDRRPQISQCFFHNCQLSQRHKFHTGKKSLWGTRPEEKNIQRQQPGKTTQLTLRVRALKENFTVSVSSLVEVRGNKKNLYKIRLNKKTGHILYSWIPQYPKCISRASDFLL